MSITICRMEYIYVGSSKSISPPNDFCDFPIEGSVSDEEENGFHGWTVHDENYR